MTTNAGAENLERGFIGFAVQDEQQESMSAIKHCFSPEFRNRLDATVQFKYLDDATVLKVVDKFIRELRDQLKEKGVKLNVTSAAKQWLAKQGYNQKMGARPMARLIQEKLKLPLADELLFGHLEDGDEVEVGIEKGELRIRHPVTFQ